MCYFFTRTLQTSLMCFFFFFLVLAQRLFQLRDLQDGPEYEQLQRLWEETLLHYVSIFMINTKIWGPYACTSSLNISAIVQIRAEDWAEFLRTESLWYCTYFYIHIIFFQSNSMLFSVCQIEKNYFSTKKMITKEKNLPYTRSSVKGWCVSEALSWSFVVFLLLFFITIFFEDVSFTLRNWNR